MRMLDTLQLPNIPLNLMQRYLAATGWKLRSIEESANTPYKARLLASRSGGYKGFDIYLLENAGDSLEILLPRDNTVSEYQTRISGALKTLEDVEDRDVSDIVADITSIGFDVVRSHIPNSYLTAEAIYLDSAVEYMRTLRSLLASSATTELHPAPFYGRVRKEAAAYSDRCLFGHTFRGSFGFTVQSPLTVLESTPVLFEVEREIPFERRVIQRLAATLGQVSQAAIDNTLETAVDNSQVGLSANGFDILANLIANAGGQVSLSFSFSREWASVLTDGRSPFYTVSAPHIEIAREAAKILRRRPVSQDASVRGLVVTLRNETNPAQLMEDAESREVQIAWNTEDFGDIRVRVALNASDYLKAIEAHGLGRTVSVRGTLEKVGVRWFLRKPKEFSSIS